MYHVDQHGVRIEFRLEDGQDPGSVDNVDAVVEMPDGRRWGATLITVSDVERILERWRSSGESDGGRYLRVPDLILMSRPGVDEMVAAILDLVKNEEHLGLTSLPPVGHAEEE